MLHGAEEVCVVLKVHNNCRNRVVCPSAQDTFDGWGSREVGFTVKKFPRNQAFWGYLTFKLEIVLVLSPAQAQR